MEGRIKILGGCASLCLQTIEGQAKKEENDKNIAIFDALASPQHPTPLVIMVVAPAQLTDVRQVEFDRVGNGLHAAS